eukprot:CAMPEP_0197420402 /NCGR_PEP_ID=MMETSP1170-20131217/5837_1 /TAXON_ID=54406 /ORGANISM="Sarcinochrysis sp, Strain CCMP770" /LENGTH=87 /DNA_ID=CAMNT_0042947565 /DNA_START=91 /DNA_END=354 /DNA_ORIENTATION=+
MKLSLLLIPAVAAFAPQAATFQRSTSVEAVSRRDLIEAVKPAALALAVAAPLAAEAAKPPQLQSMAPPGKEKSGQIKTGNAGSILKK